MHLLELLGDLALALVGLYYCLRQELAARAEARRRAALPRRRPIGFARPAQRQPQRQPSKTSSPP